jgi:hypothetical protein
MVITSTPPPPPLFYPTKNKTHAPEICEQTWWANFVYVNNFITRTNGATGLRGYSCMPASWYLAGKDNEATPSRRTEQQQGASTPPPSHPPPPPPPSHTPTTPTPPVDFQLFLLAPPVAFFAAACPRLALLLLGLGATASAAYTAAAGSAQGWTFQMIGGGEGFAEYFVKWYIKPWTRAPPSLIGMGLAVLLFHWGSRRDNKTAAAPHTQASASGLSGRSLAAWAAALALTAAATEGARGAYTTVPSSWAPWQFCVYLACSRLGWGLGLALLAHRLFLGTVLYCCTGFGFCFVCFGVNVGV